jgi:SpoVK/Ycf46/Vps4 family AAA+-type ATPase
MPRPQWGRLMKSLGATDAALVDEQLAQWNTLATGEAVPPSLRALDAVLTRVDSKGGMTVAQKYGLDLRSLSTEDLKARFIGTPLSPQSGVKDLLAMQNPGPSFDGPKMVRDLAKASAPENLAMPEVPDFSPAELAALKIHLQRSSLHAIEDLSEANRTRSLRSLGLVRIVSETSFKYVNSDGTTSAAQRIRLSDDRRTLEALVDFLRSHLSSASPPPKKFESLSPREKGIARELFGAAPGPRKIGELPEAERRLVTDDREVLLDDDSFLRDQPVKGDLRYVYYGNVRARFEPATAARIEALIESLRARLEPDPSSLAADLIGDATMAVGLAHALNRPDSTIFRGQTIGAWEKQTRTLNPFLKAKGEPLRRLVQEVEAATENARRAALEGVQKKWEADPSQDFGALLESRLKANLVSTGISVEKSFGGLFPRLGNAPELLLTELADPETHRAWLNSQRPDLAFGETISAPKLERVVPTPPEKAAAIAELVRVGDVGGQADKLLLEQMLSTVDGALLKALQDAGYSITVARNNVTNGAADLRSAAVGTGFTVDHSEGVHATGEKGGPRIIVRTQMEDGKLTLDAGVLMHEIGHALDLVLKANGKDPLHVQPAFAAAFTAEHQRLRSYFHNPAEFMAEVFARYSLDPERTHREFPLASKAFDALKLGDSLVDGASMITLNASMLAKAPVTSRPDAAQTLREFESINRIRSGQAKSREPYIFEMDGEPAATQALTRELGRQLLTLRAPKTSPLGARDGSRRVDAATFNDPSALTKILSEISGGPGAILYIDDLVNIRPSSPGFTTLKDFNERSGDRVPLVIAGNKEARKAFASVLPNTLRKTIEIDPLTPDQVAELVKREVTNDGYQLSVQGEAALEKRSRAGGYDAAMELWRAIKQAQFARVARLATEVNKQPGTVADVLARDVEAAKVTERKDPIGNIQRLIGLSAVKEKIGAIMGTTALAKQAEALGLELAEPPRLNLLFAGNPGTGKTTVAKELAQGLFEQGYLKRNKVAFAKIQDGKLLALNEASKEWEPTSVKKLFEDNKDGVIFIDELHQLKDTAEGKNTFRAMIPYLADVEYKRTAFIGAGYSDELGELLRDVDVGAQRRFVSVPFADYSRAELGKIVDKMVLDAKLTASDEAKTALLDRVMRKQRAMKNPGNAGDVETILGLSQEKQRARLTELSKTRKLTAEDFTTLALEDVAVPNPLTVESVWAQIDAVKGNEKVKSQLRDLQYLIDLNKQLGDDPLTGLEPYVLIEGSPGSDTPAFAKLIAKMMAANEIVPESEVEPISGGDLVGGFVGNSTTLAVRKAFDKSRGKTLFINGIGALAKAVGGFEEQAAKEIVDQMGANRGKFILVVADSPDNVDQFLRLDPELSGKFGLRLSLENLTGSAAREELSSQLTQLKLTLDPALEEHLTKRLETLSELPGWASAGDVRTLANKVKAKQATEYMTQRKAGKSFEVTRVDRAVLDRALNEMQTEIERRPDPNQRRESAPSGLALNRKTEKQTEKIEETKVAVSREDQATLDAIAQVDTQFGAVFNDDPEELKRQSLDPNSNYNQALGRKLGVSAEAAKQLRISIKVKVKKLVESMDPVAVQRFEYHCPFCGGVDSPTCDYINFPLEWKVEHSTKKPWTETVMKKTQKEVVVEETPEWVQWK